MAAAFPLKRTYSIAAVSLLVVALSALLASYRFLLSQNYLPHRYCYLVQPGLVWTHVVTDGLIAASYAVIFGCLYWIARRLRDLPELKQYLWIFIAFGTFIGACGATHIMELVTVWVPLYRLSAAVKVVCALASVPTAFFFARASAPLAASLRGFLQMASTTRHEKEQAMEALVAAEKLSAAGRISASIAHEIRNPLDTINNLLYLLRQEPGLSDDGLHRIEQAEAEVERAGRITRNTLSLHRQSARPTHVSLSALVHDVVELQQLELTHRSISFDIRIRRPDDITAYPGELRQILLNLIQNAAFATSPGGRIWIRVQQRSFIAHERQQPAAPAQNVVAFRKPVFASAAHERAQVARLLASTSSLHADQAAQPGIAITVADSGRGIDSAHRSRLFEPFFTTKGEEGNGLGLWLVHSLVARQGGNMRCRSRSAAEHEKTGTIFSIWLPLQPPAGSQLPDEGAA